MEKLLTLDALRSDEFLDDCDQLLKKKLEELRQRLLPVGANDTNTINTVIDENDIADDIGGTAIYRPRRTASRTADLKIKQNLNMPLKLRRPSSGSSHNGTFKMPKTTRTRVIKKHNADGSSSAAEKSVVAIDEMNLVKKRTEQFEKMSKDQQVPLTPSRRNEAAATNINECVAMAIATSSQDNVNNNVVSSATTTSVSVETNVEECTTTTTTTKRVTRTKTRNANKLMLAETNDVSNAASSSNEDVFIKPPKGGRTKIRKELRSKLDGVLQDDEPEVSKVDREALAQTQKEKENARKAEKAEQEARKAEEEAKRAEAEAKKAEEEARRAEETRIQELEKKEKEREREEKLARAQEAAAKKKEAEKAKKLAMEKKRQELAMKKEAIKRKHEEMNKQRELDAKKREELLQANAAKKKEAVEANSKAHNKVADIKENMKPNQNTKPPVKPGHPVVSQLKNATFTSSNYNMTPSREEREPQKPKTANDYGIDDAASSDSSDDESNPKKIVPNWAKSSQLNEMVMIQSHLPLDLFHFTMSCDTEPYKTLGYVNKIKRPRTSSAVWHTPMNIGQ
ncbi:hypothetical protein LSTR_LSTR006429 [Laodelphax striatellus]|uniref:Inner centromere protein ARK-binding domain-containing protein n=1 Tax=Laodelphax striatellus TaxID=195883 RepID=A0A482WYA5_LAOST|nr:hypothetical protein LSTR_LSTR006429 [Laodelphax striatellus]